MVTVLLPPKISECWKSIFTLPPTPWLHVVFIAIYTLVWLTVWVNRVSIILLLFIKEVHSYVCNKKIGVWKRNVELPTWLFLKWERKSLASSSISPLYLILGVLLVMFLGKMDKRILCHLQGIRKPGREQKLDLNFKQDYFPLYYSLCYFFFHYFLALVKQYMGILEQESITPWVTK